MGMFSRKTDVESVLAAIDKPDLEKARAGIEQLLGDGDVQGLVRVLRERDAWASDALEALGHLGDAEAVPVIVENLESQHRPEAMWALGAIGDERGIQPIVDSIAEGFSGGAEGALAALSANHRPQVVAAVSPLLEHKSGFVRTAAISCLRAVSGDDVVPHLAKVLERDDLDDRIGAMSALRSIGGETAEAALAAHGISPS